MSDFGEAFGTASEGGLFARAIDKERGKASADAPMREGHFAEDACLNCGTILTGKHCHNCGQKAHLHRTIGAFLHDLVHGALHFDGKMWRTLPLLAWKPGELTRRYIDGERQRFVSPMALFLFAVFLMFAVFQAIGLTPPAEVGSSDAAVVEMDAARDEVRDEIAAIEGRLDALPPGDPARGELETELDATRQALRGLDTSRAFMGDGEEGGSISAMTGIPTLDEGLVKKWRENPGLMLYKLQANGYKFSWLLIPISIPVVWLLFFWKRRFRAYDHAIFTTYSLAFMSLLFIALSLLYAVGVPGAAIAILAIAVPPIHIYRQLRGAYELRRRSAGWRTIVLLHLIVLLVIPLFLWLLLILGAF